MFSQSGTCATGATDVIVHKHRMCSGIPLHSLHTIFYSEQEALNYT